MTPDEARAWAAEHGLSLRYGADLDALSPLQAPFVQLGPDAGLAGYLETARRARHGWWMSGVHVVLRAFLSDFDVNGLLGTYPMHVASTAQFAALLGRSETEGHLLDVGSGRGDVLGQLAPLFERVTATETSRAMARRLRRQGYEVLERDIAAGLDGARYDAVSLLNVLDRCDRPLSLLATARAALRPGGLLLLALVLPYRPFVFEGPHTRPPAERLPITAQDFEGSAVELVRLGLAALGLEPVALSRCPYLSGGDASSPLYELDDLLVVCRAVGEPPPILGSGR